MNKIIVASDLSDRSAPALARAVELTLANAGELIVYSVVSDDIPEKLVKPVQMGATQLLADQVSALADGRSLRFDVHVEIGDPLALINEFALSSQADLLVVGPHRRRMFLDEIRETTVEHLIRSSDIPVLLVANKTTEAYQRVLCGTAFSKACVAAFGLTPKVAPGAKCVLFHAHKASFQQESTRDFEIWRAMNGLPEDMTVPVLVEDSPEDALKELMTQSKYDLIAIGGHTRAEGGRYFMGRFTAGLIRKPPCDLLIAK